MKSIKFRAFDKEIHHMLFDIQDVYNGIPYSNIRNELDYCMIDKVEKDFNPECFGDFLSSERFLVMQYIGLKDHEGNEIYEGDIIESGTDKMLIVIEYKNDAEEFGVTGRSIKHHCRYMNPNKFINNVYCKVVGNICEDPELLEVEG